MKFHKDLKIITMSLVDLEHCGFNYEEFLGELFLNGIDDKEAEMPVMLAVDFIGGAVITTGTPEETLKKMEDSHNQYKNYLERMWIEDD
jgi:hypothetical protein